MLKVSELVVDGENLGDFIWRVATDYILTEKVTDQVASWVGGAIASRMPGWIPFKGRFVTNYLDKNMPQMPLILLRKLLLAAGLIELKDLGGGMMQWLDVQYPIKGVDPQNPFFS